MLNDRVTCVDSNSMPLEPPQAKAKATIKARTMATAKTWTEALTKICIHQRHVVCLLQQYVKLESSSEGICSKVGRFAMQYNALAN